MARLFSPSNKAFYASEFREDYEMSGTWPDDLTEVSEEVYRSLQGKKLGTDADGKPVAIDPPPPTPEQIVAALTAAVQAHLDDAARARGYDDIKSAVTYAEEPAVAKFQAEGRAFRAWRSKVWEKCYAVMDDVNAGIRTAPTLGELIAELPVLDLV